MPSDVLAILDLDEGGVDAAGFRLVDPSAPWLSALDLAATRGDGVFETLSVAAGAPQSLEAHLTRFARSARMLDLPEPDPALWRRAVLAVAAQLPPERETFVKTVLSRGVEGGAAPTGWVFGSVAPDFTAARESGVSVVTLDRGYRSDVAQTSPWLLQGAKTLSYAVNRAALREAARRGADDVIFVSSDGVVLEGPTSTVVLRRGDTLVTPDPDLGILPGTTQAALFAAAGSWGLGTSVETVTPADLVAADAVWLVSSVRHAAPVRVLDGIHRVVDRELTTRFTRYLLSRRD